MEKEKLWLKTALDLVEKDKLDKGDSVAWSAYHASQQQVIFWGKNTCSVATVAFILRKGSYSCNGQT